MNQALVMLEAALAQLVTTLAERYEGARDREALTSYTDAIWREKVRPSLPELLAAIEGELGGDELGDDVIDAAAAGFRSSLVEALRDRGPRGSHTPVALAWRPAGPQRGRVAPTPPAAVKISDYVLAHDPARGFVYAYSHDHHQFGRAFVLDAGGSFRPLSTKSFRLGDARQAWTGAWDAKRGGVVAWCFDGKAPVGVLVRESGLAVLGSADYFAKHYDDSPPEEERVILGGDVPRLEYGEWSDLAAVFALDRARSTWVLLAETGIWELGADDTWRGRGPIPAGVLPEQVEGDREHSNGGAGGVWDARRQRVVFWFVDPGEESLCFAAWDPERGTLSRLESAGLPEGLVPGYFNGRVGGVVAEHPAFGVVVHAGPELGLFALGEDGLWSRVAASPDAPPKSRAANLAFGPDGAAVQGPGHYALDGATEPAAQGVFFVQRGGAWQRLGSARVKSPLEGLKSSGGWPVLAAAGGRIYGTASRASLETLAWTDAGGFTPLVSEEDGAAIFRAATPSARARAALFEGKERRLHALSSSGAVFRLDDDRWSVVANGASSFDRNGSLTAYDASADRIVVWGGGEKGKGDNDTWLFAAGEWRKAAAAPRPKDLGYSHDEHGFRVELDMIYDAALAKVLRVGYDELAVLDGESWRAFPSPTLRDLVTPARRVLAHDPTTGETLCVCLTSGDVVRVDLGECDLVATIDARAPSGGDDDQAARPPFDDVVFDPETRRVLTFSDVDAHAAYALDLGPAFDLAKTLRPRLTELPAAGPPGVRLYRAERGRVDVFYADAGEGAIVVRTGVLGGELAPSSTPLAADAASELARLRAERAAAGWVAGDALEPQVLTAALGRPAWALSLAEEHDERAASAAHRLGGLPSWVAAADWPRDDDGEPLGFLLELELPEELGGGGLSVFVKTDGTATEDADNNVALLPPRALSLGARTLDLDAALIERLGVEDALLASALERALTEVPIDRVGGHPRWVQGSESVGPLLLQLDLDGVRLAGDWSDAGLGGVLYVMKTRKGAAALWQYT